VTAGRGRSLQWNANNLPIQSNTSVFAYDGTGDRLKKTSAGSASLYPFGDDYEVTNGVITKYIAVGGLGIVAKRVGTETFWLHVDRLGSIQAITDGTGSDIQHRTYRPYGAKIADTSGHTESRGYIGERQDEDTGLTYLHARYYDPALGLFLSPDPAGADRNAYRYASNTPTNGVDRSGLDDCPPPTNNSATVCEEPADNGGKPPGGPPFWLIRQWLCGQFPMACGWPSAPSGGSGTGPTPTPTPVPTPTPAPTPSPNGCPGGPNCGSGEGNVAAATGVLGLVIDFFTGTGPKTTIHGPDDPMTKQLMHAPGVNFARDQFEKNGRGYYDDFKAKFGVFGGDPWLPFGVPVVGYDGLFGGVSLTRQVVGSYRVDIYAGPGGRLDFYVTNDTSFTSLAYGIAPSWNRSSSIPTPMGTTSQTYYWSEPGP